MLDTLRRVFRNNGKGPEVELAEGIVKDIQEVIQIKTGQMNELVRQIRVLQEAARMLAEDNGAQMRAPGEASVLLQPVPDAPVTIAANPGHKGWP